MTQSSDAHVMNFEHVEAHNAPTDFPSLSEHPLFKQAVTLVHRGDWGEALELLEQLAPQFPDHAELRQLITKTKIEAALKASAPSRGRRSGSFSLGRLIRRLFTLAIAFVVIAAAIWLYTQQIQPNLSGNLPQLALPAQLSLPETNLPIEEAQFLLSDTWQAVRTGDVDQAQDRLSVLLHLVTQPDTAKVEVQALKAEKEQAARYQEAVALADAGDWEKALPRLREIAAQDPNYRDVQQWIAAGEEVMGVTQAFESAQQAYAAGDWATAIEQYEAVLTKDPGYQQPVVQERLADSYAQQAATLLETAADDPATLEQALTLYDQALALDPQHTAALEGQQLAQSYQSALEAVEQQDWEQAVGLLEEVVAAKPDFAGGQAGEWLAQSYIALGKAASQAGELEMAQAYFEKAAGVAQQGETAVSSLIVEAHLQAAQVAEEKGDLETALQEYQAVFDLVRENPALSSTPIHEIQLSIAERAAGRQDWETAIQFQREALLTGLLTDETQPGYAVATFYVNQGDKARSAGDLEAAWQAYQQALTAIQTGQETILYIVKPGDTLAKIAAEFGTDVQTLAELNQIANPRLIRVGQEIRIPVSIGGVLRAESPAPPTIQSPTPSSEVPQGTFVYTVVPGDSLSALAARFGTDVSTLVELNQIENPSLIRVGQTLLIPVVAEEVSQTAVPPTAPANTQPEEPVAIKEDTFLYTVVPGDTLYELALRYGTDVDTLVKLNNIENPRLIRVGQQLLIPSSN